MIKSRILFSAMLGMGLLTLASCSKDDGGGDQPLPVSKLTPEMMAVRDNVPAFPIIGHRGTAVWAPESTEASDRWARNAGVDYLEADMQLTKDGHVVIFHDMSMEGKSNVVSLFPDRFEIDSHKKKVYYIRDFTLAELETIDFGSWYKDKVDASYWRSSFAGLHILKLRDLIEIAKGNIPVRDAKGMVTGYKKDDKANDNRPGVYIETKVPEQNPPGSDIEQAAYDVLTAEGWNVAEQPAPDGKQFYKDGHVNVGNTNGRVILQTFSQVSLAKLGKLFQHKLPMCQLLWLDPSDANSMSANTPLEFQKWINKAVHDGAVFMGPSIPVKIKETGGDESLYSDLVTGFRTEMIHNAGMFSHPYTFDKVEDMEKFYKYGNGMFTNIGVQSIHFLVGKGLRDRSLDQKETEGQILDDLGYTK